MVRALILTGLLALASCASNGGTFCEIASPFRPSAATIATMSESEVAAALAHNERGAALCGWKP